MAHHFHFRTPVLRTAFFGSIIGYGHGGAKAFKCKALWVDTFAHQVFNNALCPVVG